VTIADIGEVYGGGTPPARQATNFSDDEGIPWVTPADMSGRTGAYIRRGRRNLSEVGLTKSSARLLPSGTVIFSSRAPIGYCAVAANPVTTSQGCKNIVLRAEHVPEYLMLYLRHSRAYAESLASGTTFLELSAAKMKTVAVPLPPPDEQAVIVVALDYLLGRIETIKGLLHSLPKMGNSETERLLSEAYDGRLTETWRLRASAKTGVATQADSETSTDSGAFAFEEVKVSEMLAIPIQNGLSIRGQDAPPGIRALRLSALRSRRVDLEDIRYLPIPLTRAKRYELADGDVLVSRGNGTKSLVGRASLTDTPHELTIFPDTAFRLRTDPTRVNPAWLALVWNAPQVRRRIERKARTTTGIWKIRQADVVDHKLPLPSIEEQSEVVRILHGSLGRIDALTKIATQALDNLEKLRETLMSLAFRGELAKDGLERLSRTTLAELRQRAVTAEKDWASTLASPQLEGPVKMSRILKSLMDPDVRNKPYLANLLKSVDEEGLSAKALFAITELSVADFYKQLMWELRHRHLVENGDEFRAVP
jgi:type I restriction enzyme S subunit